MNYFSLLALVAGVAIALQAGMNAQLGVMLKSPVLAAAVTFTVACCCALLVVAISSRQLPAVATLQFVPWYLWCSGAISALGVAAFYFLIPRMGAGSMMSYALTGQLLMAMLISHSGLFNLPAAPITHIKMVGFLAMILGMALINRV
jgi:transporter family-2 protein